MRVLSESLKSSTLISGVILEPLFPFGKSQSCQHAAWSCCFFRARICHSQQLFCDVGRAMDLTLITQSAVAMTMTRFVLVCWRDTNMLPLRELGSLLSSLSYWQTLEHWATHINSRLQHSSLTNSDFYSHNLNTTVNKCHKALSLSWWNVIFVCDTSSLAS